MSFEGKHTGKFWEERFGTAVCAGNYHYYAYEHLDDLSFLPPAMEVFNGWRHAPELLEEVSAQLKSRGWEGTGEFQMLWLPPFSGAGPQDNFGCYALHVKQVDDGISWIVSPVPLPFHRLFQSDAAVYPPPNAQDQGGKPQRKGKVRWLRDLLP